MFTTIKVVSRHEDIQLYGAIFLDELTNEAIKDFESYKEYYAIASGAEPPKTKASVKKKQAGSDKTKTPPTAKGKRLKTSAKAAKPAKQKQPAKTSKAKGLTVLSEVALTEVEKMKLATKRSRIQTHSSQASGSGVDEGTSRKPGVPDVSTYGSDDEQISWKSSDEENDDEVGMSDDDDNDDDDNNNNDNGQKYDGQDNEGQDNDNEQTDSDNDGDDFVHPKFSTHNQEKRQDEEDNEEEGSYLRVQTPSHYESTDDEENVPVSMNVEMPPSSSKTIPPPPVSLIQPLQQTPVPTPTIAPTKTSYVVADNLSEMELKKILIDKTESHRSDQQKTLYKALVDAYESDKLIIDTYGDTVTIKRCRDDQDEDKEPSARSNRGSKRRRARKELESTSAPKEKTSKSSGKYKEGFKSHHTSTDMSAQAEEPIHADEDLEEPAH
ncbi:hypothetical protein Tco_1090446 [Tanacetum coccineum]|uniref:Uncharacterized protein n=1 Tax=Tanacetum coccineum TaxID=301880 RepID=A0ABQ5I6A0_9ASTR